MAGSSLSEPCCHCVYWVGTLFWLQCHPNSRVNTWEERQLVMHLRTCHTLLAVWRQGGADSVQEAMRQGLLLQTGEDPSCMPTQGE